MLAAHPSRHTRTVGILCGLVVAAIWSGWSVATRFAVTTSLGPQDVTFLRFGVSALLLWPVLLRNGVPIARIGTARLVMMVAGAGVPFMMLASTGVRYAPASHIATLMIGMMPIWVAVLSHALLGEKLTARQLVASAIVLAGAFCIGGWAVFADRATGEWRGDLLFLLAGVLFAGFTVAQRRSGIGPWHAIALVNVFSALLFAPVYFLWLEPGIFAAPVRAVAFQVVAQGVAVAIVAMYFYAQAVRRLGAPGAAMFGALAPALAALIAAILLDEWPGAFTWLGIVLVTSGVARFVTRGPAQGA